MLATPTAHVRFLLTLAAIMAVAPSTARAEIGWHAGLALRIDQGAHPVRVAGGLTFGKVDTLLVLDPMVVTDGQHDLDLIATWCPCDRPGWGLLGGWRMTSIGIADGTQLQQKLLLGFTAPLPDLGPFRARWSFELATVIVKHGAGIPREWIGFAQGRDFIDLLNFGMFVTFEYGRPPAATEPLAVPE